MAKCKYCQNLTWEGSGDARNAIKRLYSSAANGCPTCSIVQEAIQELLPMEIDPETEYILYTSAIKDRTDMLHPEDSDALALNLRVEKEPFTPEDDMTLYTTSDNPTPWTAIPISDHIPTSTGSEESAAFAIAALKECIKSHRACDSPEPKFVPTRLVDVGEALSPTHVRVIETGSTRPPPEARYCALSHCWGPPSSITTQLNKHTYEEYTTEGIAVTDLPKTFHDAVAFTRTLGCRYIWIDSLCIIQKNKEDWIREGGHMCEVYEHSLVTLAAASSSSGHGGLFYDSPRLDITREGHTVHAKFDVNHRFFSFPLMNRAWVLQERLLSPRTLYFTKQELVWECRERNICQCSPILGGFQHQVAGFPVNSKIQPPSTVGYYEQNPQALVWKWHEVVQVYSQLQLTQPTDKIMAVDGVAQFMAPIRKSTCLAGLWQDSFAWDLVWWVDMFDWGRTRTLDWLVPSWSWASMGREARWHSEDIQACQPEKHFCVAAWPEPRMMHGIPHWEDKEYGKPLQLQGIVVQTTTAEVDLVVNSSPCLYEDVEDWTPSEGHTKDDEPLYCLRLLQSKDRAYSLALRRVGDEDPNTFARHGLLVYMADPEEDNDVWNNRDTKPRHKFSPRDYRKGYPSWWSEGDLKTISIV